MSGTGKDHWYPWLKQKLEDKGYKVDSPTFPSNLITKEEILLKFAEKYINEDTVIIGHSSGAALALRVAEKHKIKGLVLVCGLFKDLGYEEEISTGIFAHSWDWQKIRSNQDFLIQFDSDKDPYIPQKHFHKLAENTRSEHIKLRGRGHFGSEWKSPKKFPELLERLEEIMQ